MRRRSKPIKGKRVSPKLICVGGKVGYPSKEYAEDVLARIHAGRRWAGGTKPQATYLCSLCARYHVTSFPSHSR